MKYTRSLTLTLVLTMFALLLMACGAETTPTTAATSGPPNQAYPPLEA